MRLRRRKRVDGLQNDVRAPGKPKLTQQWGRYVYLGLLTLFFGWVINLFVGDLLYFKVDGLVVQDRVVIATQYDASVLAVQTTEGEAVQDGDTLIRLKSQSVEENIAELSSDVARLMERTSALHVRKSVVDATTAVVNKRAHEARRAREELEAKQAYFTARDRLARIEAEAESLRQQSATLAEGRVIARDLPELERAVATAKGALSRLVETYSDGQLIAPVDGVVGYLHVAPGSVVKAGTPLMEVYTGEPYVLAYVPEGAIYDVRVGDEIDIAVGFRSYQGSVTQLYPVTATLPKEYADALRVPQRAPLARIEFADVEQNLPSLFAQTEVSAAGLPPRWVQRLFGFANAAEDKRIVASDASEVSEASRTVPMIDPQLVVTAQAEAGFTVQLFASFERARVATFVRDSNRASMAARAIQDASGTRYVAVDGFFLSKRDATDHAGQLRTLGFEPWVRSTQSLRQVDELRDVAQNSVSTGGE